MSPTDGTNPEQETTSSTPPAASTVRGDIEEFFSPHSVDERTRVRPKSGIQRYERLLVDLEERLKGSKQTPAPELGSFQLENFLGKGGMGAVFKAIHHRTGAHVALKIVPEEEKGKVAALLAEAHGLASLNHPNIIKIVDQGTDGGFAYIATELVEGNNLRAEIDKRGGIPLEGDFLISFDGEKRKKRPVEAPAGSPETPRRRSGRRERLAKWMTWFRDLASALHAMHEIGLIHRDVKPKNIMIGAAGRPYLIDFGLSVSPEGQEDIHGILAGTVPYMSPEQTLSGYVALTPKSDLYSLAVSFHELLTGKRVAESSGQGEMLQEIAFGEVPPPSRGLRGIPGSLDPIFTMALAKHPDRRYLNGQQLSEDIDRWLQQKPLIHAPETARIRASRFARVHPAITSLLILAVIVPLTFFGVGEFQQRAEMRRILGEIRDHIRAEDYKPAFALLREYNDDFGASREFEAHYTTAVAATVPGHIAKMIATQSISVGALARRTELFKTYARNAILDLKRIHNHAGLLFIVGFADFMAGNAPNIVADLDKRLRSSAGKREDPLLLELRAVALLDPISAGKGDTLQYLELLKALKPDPNYELPHVLTCMRSYRILWHDMIARQRGTLKRPLKELEQAWDELRRILESIEDHRLARTLHARFLLERGDRAQRDFIKVHEEFERIAIDAGPHPERTGAQFYCALSALLIEPRSDEERNRLRTNAAVHARSVLKTVPGLESRFIWETRRLMGDNLDYRVGEEIITLLLRVSAAKSGPPIPLLRLAESMSGKALGLFKPHISVSLGEKLAPFWREDLDPKRETHHEMLLTYQLWGFRMQLQMLEDSRKMSAELHAIGGNVVQTATRETRRRGSLPYEAVVVTAWTAAKVATKTANALERHAWDLTAVIWLGAAASQEALDKELKRTSNAEFRENLITNHRKTRNTLGLIVLEALRRTF